MIQIEPCYKHLVQMKSLCGAACVQMILFRKGVFIDQEEIAKRIGVRVRKGSDLYCKNLDFAKEDNSDAGIDILDFKNKEVIEALRDFNLIPKVYLCSDIENPKGFILENLRNNKDIIANFHWNFVDGGNNGHHVLICGINLENDEFNICDPSFDKKKRWTIKINKLMESMSSKSDGKERGFIVFEYNK